MGAIAEMADRVVVMYAGRMVEKGGADAVLAIRCIPTRAA